ncbi:MAG: hypothetical protein WBA16_01315 [Nonlabens sp.]
MSSYQNIERKLKKFISKYYRNELLRGLILFLAIGLLYFLLTVVIEHFLWLSPLGRTVLFWLFVAVQVGLLVKFVVVPLARLLKLSSGIGFRDASTMIGTHFPEVSDKLVNVLQLRENGGDDELTWASIDQKSAQLEPIPFSLAIDFKKNKKYLPYLAVPLVIIAILFATGNNKIITDSASRVADFNNEYLPPAPFTFRVLNDDLSTLQKKPYTLEVEVNGTTLPETVNINYNDQTYFLTQQVPGRYSYTFDQPQQAVEFNLSANEVTSRNYTLDVRNVPIIKELRLNLDYPAYTGKRDEVLTSTGNALVPQGTKITWNVATAATTQVAYRDDREQVEFTRVDGDYAFAKAVLQPTPYSITTSNDNVQDYESLDFRIDVIRDEFPELTMESKKDSIDDEIVYYKGRAADDYGIRTLQLVYYKADDTQSRKTLNLGKNRGTFDQFLLTFPGKVELEPGNSYQYYFEVIDNDAVNRYKSTKSEVYSYRKASLDEVEEKQLTNQKESLSNLEKSLADQKQQQKKLDQLAQEQIEKKQRGFNDKKKLDQALKNQQKQEQRLRQQMERMKDNLQKSTDRDDPDKKQLEERMEKSAEEIKKNEELLKKLQEYQDKLSKEELKEQLEKAQKNSKQQQRNLEQLLELTKRYYVQQKFEQMGRKLQELAEKQEEQSEKDGEENKSEEQEKLNEEYKKWEEELKELEKENDGLKDPMDMEFEPEEGDEIKEEQEGASEDLKKQETPSAQKKQKSAAKKMKEQAQKMAAQMQQKSQESLQEDAEMLRQILDNLIVFSVEQEDLLEEVKEITKNSPSFGKKLKVQKDLEKAFKHVDDSLFALATRNPKIGDEINKEVTDIYYYLEKSMEQLGEFQMNQGGISQQFTLKGANTLAEKLSNTMDAMNNAMSMPGSGMPKPGQGQGQGFQLQDIIQKQESLSKGGKKPGKKPGDKPGQGEQPGAQGQQGQAGEQGQSGQDGKSGQQGENGQSGKNGQGKNGEQGEGGKNGQGGSGNGGQNGEEGENSYRESEQEAQRVYEIYKQQQELRNQLKDMIKSEGLQEKVNQITDQMKSVERKLLDQGYDRDVQQRMMDIQHEMLKLQDASLKQGKEEKREANTNRTDFENRTNARIPDASKYFNNKEILNRQVLPLQPQYRNRVKAYFKSND